MFFLSLREIKYSKLRYLLISFIIVLISLLVFMVSGLAKGLSMDNASSIINSKANYFYVEKDTNQSISRSRLPMDVVNGLEGVDYSPLRIAMSTVVGVDNDKKEDITFFGTEGSVLNPVITEGKALNELKEYEILVSSEFKNQGFSLGDKVKIEEAKQELTIAGFSDAQSFSHTPVVYIPFDEWKKIVPSMPNATEKMNTVFFQLTDDEVAKVKKDNVELITKEDVLNGLPSYSQEQMSLNMMVAFLYVIGAFVLAVFFYVITLQKRNQFGVLKAIGATTKFLAASIVGQVVVLTIVSIGIGLGTTLGISQLFSNDLPFYLSSSTILQSCGILLIVSVVGAFISLFSVMKVDAIEAIGKVD